MGRSEPSPEEASVLTTVPMWFGLADAARADQTITQLAGAGNEALREISGIVHRVPCYLVRLGEDLGNVSQTMAELLDRQQ